MSYKRRVIAIIAAIALVVAWQIGGDLSSFTRILISTPTRIAGFALENWAALLGDLLHTSVIAAAGLLIAFAVGMLLALSTLFVPAFYRPLAAISTVFQTVPLVVFTPFLIILFGVGYISKILLAFIMSVFATTIGLSAAIQQAESEYRELCELYGIKRRTQLLGVYIPHMLPTVIATTRVAAGLALLGAVIAEFTGSVRGLGRNIFLGTVRLDPELMMSSLILMCLVGYAAYAMLDLLERRTAWWS